MEKVEVEFVSRKTIKPSSPTPHHLLHYQLSFLDQISPPVYIPLVLFYSAETNRETRLDRADISTRLKSSLSETLTRYYPLSGRLRDKLAVECTDEGVPFLETRVMCRLSDMVQNQDTLELRKLVPFAINAADDVILGVQFNVFEYGGIAVGICLSHKVADGLSVFVFVRTWAAICRGEVNVVSPEFLSATLFPPKDLSGYEPSTGIVTENIVSKRFVFKSNGIELLKAKYSAGIDSLNQRPPTRVEALSTFIWSRFASSTQVFSQAAKLCFLVHAVNLRTKFDPPLTEHSFRNLYRVAITFLSPGMNGGCGDLVPRVRETIAGIDRAYVERLREGDEHLSFINQASEMYREGEMISLNVTSWCRFSIYEADFGWEKPTWVGSPALPYRNLVVLMDMKSGDGIEAYIHLKEEDMVKFESDEELQKYIAGTA
ncbi:hypothetical protein CDL15_Pgr024471 [Punica granatum]|uniref:Stemmadenine O-acetyltransferase-like n=1 Tax=Punica granatum TaxID=22663 RepID=A0A218XXJ7_PUNGR|nr:hypothetical protein CDL15_Pgr024471 [Punica granatum]